MWQELETFETGLNKITASNSAINSKIHGRSLTRAYASADGPPPTSKTPWSTPSSPLTTFLLSTATVPSCSTNIQPTREGFVGAWKSHLQWEESHPREIEEKDKASLVTRLQGVYRKAVIRMRFYAEIWYILSSLRTISCSLPIGIWHMYGATALASRMRR